MPSAEGPPAGPPIGVTLAATAKAVSRAFDEALQAAGGSRPTWLVLMALKRDPGASQREVALAVGIEGATLTHHLNAMERAALLVRRRDPADRRVHVVELTDAGDALFHRLRRAAIAFDDRLRDGLDAGEVDELARTLRRLHDNVAGSATAPDARTRRAPGSRPA